MATTTTNSKTSAKTSTFQRIVAVKYQFRTAFIRIMSYQEKQYSPYLEAIDEKKISSISFWAYKYNEQNEREKWCQLTMFVDWNKHNSFLLDGRDSVVLKKEWNGVIPEVDSIISAFEEIITTYALTPTFSVQFDNNLNSDEYDCYMKKLGLVKGTSVSWKTDIDYSELSTIIKTTLTELQEMSLELQVCDKV